MESLKKSLGQLPEILVPDTGYGSEENYEYLENHHIEAFVKFNNFHKEQTKKWKENPKTKGKKNRLMLTYEDGLLLFV